MALKLLLLSFAVLYAGLVIMTYRTNGSRYRPDLNGRDPARLLEGLAIWLGVRAVAAVLRFGRRLFEMLSETSADLGEWFIRRQSRHVQESVRSRFLL